MKFILNKINQNPIFRIFFSLFAAFVIVICLFNSLHQVGLCSPECENLLIHEPIIIVSDTNFTTYNFPGEGTSENPYLIQNYHITADEGPAISVQGTFLHFTIQNCQIEGRTKGILVSNVGEGTVSIINNTITTYNQFGYGISLYHSDSPVISFNTIFSNAYGLHLHASEDAFIHQNIVIDSKYQGIYLVFSSNNATITNNILINNSNGIAISHSDFIVISNNSVENNHFGVSLSSSDFSEISSNHVTKHTDPGINGGRSIYVYNSYSPNISRNIVTDNTYGIFFYDVTLGVITENFLRNNSEYAIYFGEIPVSNCSVHHNSFIGNCLSGTSQAYDDGTLNIWYDNITFEGNYWSDYNLAGSYSIDGSAYAVDPYPLSSIHLTHNLTIPIIISPNGGETLNNTVTIQWTAVTDFLGYVVTYEVSYSADNGSTWTVIATELTTANYNWDTTTVTDGTDYLVKVVATYVEGLTREDKANGNFIISNHISNTSNSTEASSEINVSTSKTFSASPEFQIVLFVSGIIVIIVYRQKKVY